MSTSSAPAVTFANAPAVIIGYLRPLLDDLLVCHDVPDPRPTTFVRVLRTGGPCAGVVDQAQLTFESWDRYHADVAEANAQMVRRLINDLPGQSIAGHAIYRVVELAGPGELPDPFSDDRRSTWSAQVWIRGN